MATIKNINKSYCDEVYSGLADMKKNILAMQDDLARTYGRENATSKMFARHLCELADQIDWKLQILSHACPYDWKGSAEIEYADNTVSVGQPETFTNDFSGGYVGG